MTNWFEGEAFFLGRATYLGRAAPWNPSAGPTFSPKSETPVTKPASAAAPLAEPSPSFFSDSTTLAGKLTEAYLAVRGETERRAAPLSAEDQLVQSMPDASPTKWHRAHVTWFWEQLLLVPNDPSYRIFDQRFPFLFNSYYVAAGPRHARPQRGLITRPNGADVAAYRAHVDAAVKRLIENVPSERADYVLSIVEIGI